MSRPDAVSVPAALAAAGTLAAGAVALAAGALPLLSVAAAFAAIVVLSLFRWILPALLPAPYPVLRFMLETTALCGGFIAGLSLRSELSVTMLSWTGALWTLSMMFGSVAAAETNRRAMLRAAKCSA